ncbi:cellulose biosynthesis protein BcsD [Ideonella sp.]|uniref:cellulose biosynthesis protein BcsD n=1 Tax=Ideonella sp. TaxID=1929293 RepID=UPI003BB5B10C
MNNSLLEYLAEKQVAGQWRGFLAALAPVLLARLGLAEVRALMHAAGEQFAAEHSLPACRNLDELELAISKVWVDANWGWVMLEEAEDSLRMRHFCAPLAVAFNDPELAWSGAFLEGAYQVWLSAVGAGPALRVRQLAVADDGLSLSLELRR